MMVIKRIPSCTHYAITTDGRVLSIRRGKWLKQAVKDGYNVVDLPRATPYIHRLVLETFVGPCPDGMEACHANGNRLDNRLENLRWDTKSANSLDAVQHGTHGGFKNRGICPQGRQGERHGMSKLTETDVRWIRYLRKAGVGPKELSEVYPVSPDHIRRIGNHEIWRHI
jgi:hypothetical protein